MGSKEFTLVNTILTDENRNKINRNFKEYAKTISSYISRNSEILSENGPKTRLIFKVSDSNALYEDIKIPRSDVKEAINSSPHIEKNWELANDPFNILSISMSHHFVNIPKKENELKFTLLYLTMKFYTSILYRQFKYPPNPEVVDYTLEHMSNRYLMKKTDTTYEFIEYIVNTQLEESIFRERLKRGRDEDLVYFSNNLKSRVSSAMKNFTDIYLKNHRSGKRKKSDNMVGVDEEGDMYLTDNPNISGNIEKIVRKIHIKMSNDSTIDSTLLKIAVNKVKELSVKKMSILIDTIRKDDEEKIRGLVNNIVAYYLTKPNKKETMIKSTDFTNTMIRVYSASKTTNEFIINIKKILAAILVKYEKSYIQTSRSSKKSKTLSCIFLYVVLYIQKYS